MQDKVTSLFKAIADPTRREIFHALVVASSMLTISQISNQFDMTRQGVTRHIKTLEEAGLLKAKVQGRECYYIANPKPLKEVNKWLQFYEKFWDNSLQNLGNYLDKKS